MANFEVEPTIIHVFEKVVFDEKLLRDVTKFDTDILGTVQWILEVEASDVEGDVLGTLEI